MNVIEISAKEYVDAIMKDITFEAQLEKIIRNMLYRAYIDGSDQSINIIKNVCNKIIKE